MSGMLLYMNFPYPVPFALITLTKWIERVNAEWVGMTDRQYAFYCNIVRCNKKDVNGVPIKFLNAPA